MAANINTETVVGAAVIAVAAGFLIFAMNSTGSGSAQLGGGYAVSAEFDSVAGINVGTDVKLAGIKVGTVTGQSLNPESYQAKLDMVISKSVTLADDSVAKVTSEGLLGSNFIALEPGGSDTKLADGGVIVNTQGAVDMWSLISEAMFNRPAAKSAAPAEDQAPPQ